MNQNFSLERKASSQNRTGEVSRVTTVLNTIPTTIAETTVFGLISFIQLHSVRASKAFLTPSIHGTERILLLGLCNSARTFLMATSQNTFVVCLPCRKQLPI